MWRLSCRTSLDHSGSPGDEWGGGGGILAVAGVCGQEGAVGAQRYAPGAAVGVQWVATILCDQRQLQIQGLVSEGRRQGCGRGVSEEEWTVRGVAQSMSGGYL